jgi:uncharacterized membrane protein
MRRMARPRTRISARVLISATVVLTVVTMALAAIGIGPRFTEVTGVDSIVISAADLKRGDLRFFSYRNDVGKEIRFILGRDESGEVVAAFDACQRCAQYRKGYTSSHGYLVCRFCGNHYKLNSHGSGIASCAPMKLPVREARDRITVDTSQLEQRQELF